MKSIVISGVSSGIGYATANEFLRQGFQVFGSVRQPADQQRLQNEFADRFTALLFDVTDHKSIEAAAGQIAEKLGNRRLDGLINNAGIAVSGPLMHLSVDELRRQMEVNLIGLLKITQLFLPLLGTDPHRTGQTGRIINISSVSGRLALPFVGAYAASKYALEGLSDSLRRELMLYGIDVILIEPGNVGTPIWDKVPDLKQYAQSRYYRMMQKVVTRLQESKSSMLPNSFIAEKIHHALTVKKPKTRYVLVKDKFRNFTLPYLLPDRWLDHMVYKVLMKLDDEKGNGDRNA